MAARAKGEETSSKSKSMGDDDVEVDEDEEEGEITPSRQSPPPPKDFPSLGDLFSQQAGISIGVCRMKHPRAGTGRSSG
jgi:hypothetical protein